MKSLWDRTLQTVASNVSSVLDTLDGVETGQHEHQQLKEELAIYKTLLDEAQMQNVEMSKQTQLLIAEKEAELLLWIEKCNSKSSSISDSNETKIDEPSLDVAKLKAEKIVIERMLKNLEEKLRDSVRDINESKIIKMKFNDLTENYENLKIDYDDLLEKDKSRSDTIENLVSEYSKLAADSADVKQDLDNQRVSDSQRLIEVLKENEILVTKMHALEHNITEFADRAIMESQPLSHDTSMDEKLKEVKNRVVNLQFDLKEKDSIIENLNNQIITLQKSTTTHSNNAVNCELEKKIEQAQYEISSLRDDVARLHTEKREADDAGRTLTDQLKRIQKQYDDLKEDMNEKVKVESAIFDNIDATVTNLKEQLSDKTALILSLQETIESANSKYQLLEEELSNNMKQITEASLESANSKYHFLEEEFLSKTAIIRSLEEVIENGKQQIEQLKNKNDVEHEQRKLEAKQSEEIFSRRIDEQVENYENKLRLSLEEQFVKLTKEREEALSHAEETFTSMMVESEAQNLDRMKELEEKYRSLISDADAVAAQAKADLTNVEERWVAKIKQEVNELEKQKNKEMISAVKAKEDEMIDKVNKADDARKEFLTLYTKESRLRKSLHNKLVELQGNIRVVCRVRPVQDVEKEQGKDTNITSFPPGSEDIIIAREGTKTRYEYDQVFLPSSSQKEVFGAFKELCVSALDGFHVCIFAYGQTGSGKTFTMEGTSMEPGISPLAISELFEIIQTRDNWHYQLTLSMLEIYNETIFDLIETKNEKLEIRQGPDGNIVVGLSEVEISNFEQVKQLMVLGNNNRAVGAHDMNKHSSRSHSIVTVTCRGKNIVDNESSNGKLHLIDLAGSERVSKTDAQGDRLKEAQNINRSFFIIIIMITTFNFIIQVFICTR